MAGVDEIFALPEHSAIFQQHWASTKRIMWMCIYKRFIETTVLLIIHLSVHILGFFIQL